MAGAGGYRWGTRPVWVARGVLWALAVAHVVEAAALARRRRRLAALTESTVAPVSTQADVVDAADDVDAHDQDVRDDLDAVDDVVVVAAPGVDVDGPTRVAAARAMGATASPAVDLVPADLPVERALRLLRHVDPRRLGLDPLYSPGGAHEAVALRRSLAERMGVVGSPLPGRAELARLTVEAQRHAPTQAQLRVAPGLKAAPPLPRDPQARWHELEEQTGFARLHGSLAPVLLAGQTAHLLAMTAGVLVAPGAAAAAIVTWSAQPALVFGLRRPDGPGPGQAPGRPGPQPGPQPGPGAPPRRDRHPGPRPRDLTRATVLRLVDGWGDNLRTWAAGHREARAARLALAAAPVPSPPAAVLFEPRRATCPWCGAGSLAERLDTIDLFLHRPGRFHLDECTGCGHVFQNPRLSPAGLDHYYDQFYEGLGGELAERTFAGMADAYRARADAVARHLGPRGPESWLDVGTGHGHFCLYARHRWPATRFDGLDTGASVQEAGRRGWLDTAYRGLFPEIAEGLPHAYDVVSMHHYLEHTRDPHRELEAVAKVLEPGGHLLVEMPDPASPWARLGRYWLGWLQPQHQHLIPHDNLVAALGEHGFEVVSSERASADGGGFDLFYAAFLALDGLAPNPRLAWRPRPSWTYRLGRSAAFTAAAPVLALAAAGDLAKNALVHRPGSSTPANAYRVVARRL